jgi:hypothetical protein
MFVGSRNRLYWTADHGAHWDLRGELPSITLIKQILPLSKSVLLLNTSSNAIGDLYRSDDSGRTFKLSLPCSGSGAILSFDKENGILYAATSCPAGVAVSKDSGRAWSFPSKLRIDSNCTQVCSLLRLSSKGRISLYLSASRPARLYNWDSSGWHTLFKDTKGLNRELPLVTTQLGTGDLLLCLTSGSNTNEDLYFMSPDGTVKKSVNCPFAAKSDLGGCL